MRRLIGELHRRSIWQVLAGYLIFAWLLFETFEIVRVTLGLPSWVEPAAAGLLIVLLPALLATASIQRGASARWPMLDLSSGSQRAVDASSAQTVAPGARPANVTTEDPAPTAASSEARSGAATDRGISSPARRAGLPGLLSWRNTIAGGAGAFGLLAVVTAVYMVLRSAGIGPAGTLVAQGTLDDRERLILADFASPDDLTDLATTITEGMRVDLAQSPTVRIHSQRLVGAALTRMGREPDALLDTELALEVAQRESVRGVVRGQITRVGSGFVLIAEVVQSDDGTVLVSRRATARNADGIVRAVDELSKKLRERIGEPLASIGRAEPLERVTTGDLEALRSYSAAIRAIDVEGEQDRGQSLLEEAIGLDPEFAMAWRKLGIVLRNRGEERARTYEALERAYQLRDRLTPRERDLAAAAYYSDATGDTPAAIEAYERLLEREPDEGTALNNLALIRLEDLRDVDGAITLLERALAVDSTAVIPFMNLITAYGNKGDLRTATELIDAHPSLIGDPTAREHEAQLWASQGEYAEAEERLRRLRADETSSPFWRTSTSLELAGLAAIEGRLAEAEALYRDAMTSNEERDLPRGYLVDASRLARMKLFVQEDASAALAILDLAQRTYPLDELDPLDRPYLELAEVYAGAGRAARAGELLTRFEAEVAPEIRSAGQRIALDRVRGAIALGTGDAGAAIEATRAADRGPCLTCALPQLGRAFERAGQTDSAIAAYTRYVETSYTFRARDTDAWHLGPIHERLGELHAAVGDEGASSAHVARLARLWEAADETLQARVESARARVEGGGE
ncbi:MAG: tetratricopeptide repeat protein [Gemmatimonadetes bacterium]|nr:tetratricopeptide repeat protein [Gemmatimonadota bacterium]